MTHLETQLLEKLRVLPADKQHEVLDFVEFLLTKTSPAAANPPSFPSVASFTQAAQSYIGVATGPDDLSTNGDHLEGYGD